MAKPRKYNGVWGIDAPERVDRTSIYSNENTNEGEYRWQETATPRPAEFVAYDEATSASLEAAASRYGVPDVDTTAQLDSAAVKAAADSSNAKYDQQLKINEPLRSSALSIASSAAQTRANTLALEQAGANQTRVKPVVGVARNKLRTATSAQFRI